MRDIKILFLVLACVGFLYFGVEPYAHTKLHPHVAAADYDFAKEDLNLAKTDVKDAENLLNEAKKSDTKNSTDKTKDAVKNAQKTLDEKKSFQTKYELFWNDIEKIDLSKGDPVKGAETFTNAGCIGCHGLKVAGFEAPMDANSSTEAYGVNPPDLSLAGRIYDKKFLAGFIKDPTMALKLSHKFNDERPFPMPAFFGAGGDLNQEIADIVAYLVSVAPSDEALIKEQRTAMNIKDEVTLNKEQNEFLVNRAVFSAACIRCHDVKYDKLKAEGHTDLIAKYMGSTPPDLSMMIRARSSEYLHNFINDTQKMLPATSMPRAGLNKTSEDQVISYLQSVGDSKKAQRESVSINIMIFFVILSVFAFLWKQYIWRNLH